MLGHGCARESRPIARPDIEFAAKRPLRIGSLTEGADYGHEIRQNGRLLQPEDYGFELRQGAYSIGRNAALGGSNHDSVGTVGSDVLITVDASNTILLKNVTLANLHQDDFLLV
jgi:hypothetical protein